MSKLKKLIAASRHGIKRPYQAMRAADEVGLPFEVMCAVLEKESYGGKNIFGHDPTIFVGAGRVTKKKYLAYKKQRQAGRGMQGVGPMQLTWWEFQDRADALGGCWKPYNNMLVGARLLSEYYKQTKSWKEVGRRYNGAEAYGVDLVAKINKWRELLD